MKKAETLLTECWVIIYILVNSSLMRKAEMLLTQFWVISSITSDFNFNEKNRNYIEVVLGNNLYDW